MWPDIQDVERNLKAFPAPKPSAEEIFADVVLARSFLDGACHYCHNHGRHSFTSVSDVKKLVASFIGRTINDLALNQAKRERQISSARESSAVTSLRGNA